MRIFSVAFVENFYTIKNALVKYLGPTMTTERTSDGVEETERPLGRYPIDHLWPPNIRNLPRRGPPPAAAYAF